MSEENVEIVRRAYQVLNDRDYSRVAEFLDPDVEFDVSRNVLNPGTYRGHAEFERMVRATDEVWNDFRTEPQELIDGGDHVVVGVRISGTGGGSGVATHMDLFNVVTLRDGKIVRLVGGIRTRAEALKAAGLSE
jgi:ketosteroid isomerase-like protein